MKISKLISIVIILISFAGCTSNSEKTDSSKTVVLTQAEIDLMLERAKAEERVRIQSELDRQEKQKQVFDEILISQGKQPRFSELHKSNRASNNKLIDIPTERVSGEGGISKIIPQSRESFAYKRSVNKTYYRCAANSMVPQRNDSGVFGYSESKQELSATLCKRSRDKKVMTLLQTKLFNKGYLQSDPLTKEQLVDGVWGVTTLEAVKKYQQDKGLLFGQMTIQTLEHIGVFRSIDANGSFIDENIAKVDFSEKTSQAENKQEGNAENPENTVNDSAQSTSVQSTQSQSSVDEEGVVKVKAIKETVVNQPANIDENSDKPVELVEQ